MGTSSKMTPCGDNMKAVQGMLGKEMLHLLIDTGCTGVLVKRPTACALA